ncbi:MAG TPA: DM13 domain-containing protein [Gemmataceae bacterium]|nr:DM13 domain-containing protein [Gemmataceae bacterium]
MLSRTKFAGLAVFIANLFLYAGTTQAQQKGSEVLAKGEFHNADKAGKGTATVYKLANGKRVLRLSNFATDNGPDLHVRLIAADDAKDTASVAKTDSVEVAKLKGNKGNQNHELSEKVDLGKYRVVSIWCNRFSVNFAAAQLKAVK